MSGIFGLIHLDGSPVMASSLAAMHAAMHEWGRDGGGTWCEGIAGLGQLVSFDTPESRHENGPLSSHAGFQLVSEARLDDRAGLCAKLGLAAVESADLPDGALVLRAYEKWGTDAPDHLLGDWSFAAWHPGQRRLFLARDPFGATGLYYFHDGRRFAFTSSRKALFALDVPRRLDEFFLACTLVSWHAQYGSGTIDLDIRRLPPAHTLTLDDGRLRIDQYWRLEDTRVQRLSRSTDYADGLLSIYDAAVRDRLRSSGPIGLSLSGGLDSGSTAVLAARALRAQGRRLTAYTSVPVLDVAHATGERTLGDELPLARAVAGAAGNIDLVPVAAQDLTPIQGIKAALAIHDEPAHAAANMFWIERMFKAAAADGVRTMLTAQGGNATVSWGARDQLAMIRRLLKGRHWKQAAEAIFYPHLPFGIIRLFRHIRHRRGLDWSSTSINPAFARRIDLSRRYISQSGDMTRFEEWYPAPRRRLAIIQPGRSLVGSIWSENSAAHGLDIRDATYDRRVMEYTFSIPEQELRDSDGMDRRMIRLAMQGLLPDEVRLNRRRGMQAADVGHRLLASAAEMESTLAELDRSEMARHYLDLGRLRAVWHALQARVDAASTHDAVTILTRGVMAGLHLVEREGLS